MSPFFTLRILSVFALAALGQPVKAESNRNLSAESNQVFAAPADSSAARSRQQANKLVAMTQPGYYSIRLVINARLQATCTNSLSVKCPVPLSPMPVKLMDFSGHRLDPDQIQLNWTTSVEQNNDRFSIERSSNPAAGFDAVGSVKGKGTTDQVVTYQFTDPNASPDYTYYRLKQLDVDGSYAYSRIIAIKGMRQALSVQVLPNPGEAHQICFQISGMETGEDMFVVIYDAQGRLLHQQQTALVEASHLVRMPAWVSLSPGRYYVLVRAKNQQATRPFLIRP